MPQLIQRWLCDDGSEFPTEKEATAWEKRLADVLRANEALKQGVSVYEVLTIAGHPQPPESLRQMTKETGLIIPHWQGSDEPAYSVQGVNKNLSLIISGQPKICVAAYGKDLSARAVAGFLEKTLATQSVEISTYDHDFDSQRP